MLHKLDMQDMPPPPSGPLHMCMAKAAEPLPKPGSVVKVIGHMLLIGQMAAHQMHASYAPTTNAAAAYAAAPRVLCMYLCSLR